MNTNIFGMTCDLYDSIATFNAYTLICERRKVFDLIEKSSLTLRWVTVDDEAKKTAALDHLEWTRMKMKAFFGNIFFDADLAMSEYKLALWHTSEALRIIKNLTVVSE